MTTASAVTDSDSPIRRVGAQAAAALATTGAFGTLFYASGLLNQAAYFWAFRSPWLCREIGAGDILRGGFVLLPSVVVALIAIAFTVRLQPGQRGFRIAWRVGTAMLIADILAIATDCFAGRVLTLSARAELDLAAAMLVSLTAACIAGVALIYAVDDLSFSFRSAAASVIVLILLFGCVPFLLGRSRAFQDLASPATNLPRARIAGNVNELPMLVATPERIFCLAPQHSKDSPTLLIYKWDNVVSITQSPEQ